MQPVESSSFGDWSEELSVSEAAAMFLSSVVGQDISSLAIEDKVACIPVATTALLSVAQSDSTVLVHAETGPELSCRQLEILRMLAHGKRPKEISWELNLSEDTVRNHIRNIRDAFGVQSYHEAISKARRIGYVE